MKAKITDLKSELEKLSAVNVVTKNFVESFYEYINELFSKELDYTFVNDNNEVKERLLLNSRKMTFYEIGLGNARDEDFKNFVVLCHLQIEDLLNYYFSKKYFEFSSFKAAFDVYAKNEYSKWYKIDYDVFKKDFEILDRNKKENNTNLAILQSEFDKKYTHILANKFFNNSYLEAVNKIQNVKDKNSIQLTDFKKKLSLFEFENQTNSYKNNLRGQMNILRNFISHNIDDTNTKTKAETLINTRNFIGCKDALKEIYTKVMEFNKS
jgi:hypothetical protein